MLERSRRSKGCWGTSEVIHRLLTPGGSVIEFKTCVGNAVRDEWYHWVTLHRQFKNGVLPYGGSLVDQPAKALEIFSVIDTFEMQKMKEAASERQANGKGKRARK